MRYINLLFLFPFVSLGLLNLDLQPYCFIAALIYFLKYSRVVGYFKYFLLPIVGLWLTIAITEVNDVSLIFRATIFYCTPLVVSHAVFFSLKYGAVGGKGISQSPFDVHRQFVRIVFLAIWINFIVAVAQMISSRDLFELLVSVRTSPERGVTGLTPEPSMYGLNLLALGVLVFCLNIEAKVKKRYLLLLIFQLLFFSQSTLAIVSFFAMLLVYYLQNRVMLLVSVISVLTLLGYSLGNSDLLLGSNIRIFDVLNQFFQDPSNILYVDGSISERFYHLVLPLYGYGLPQGLSSFSKMIVQAQAMFPSYWWGDPTDKIMSGVGGAFWELGFFALPLFLLPFHLAIDALGRARGFFVGIALMLVFIHSVTYGLPLYAMVCGYLAYLIDVRKCNNYGTSMELI